MKKEETANELFTFANENGFVATLYGAFGPCVKVKIAFSKKACETNIDELEFSVRANNAMKRAGLFTIGDIVDLIANEQLATIRNLGKKTENEIKTKILNFGYERLTDKEKKQFFLDVIENN